MTSATTQRFASKVDWWLAAIVISVPIISLGTAIAGTASGDTGAAITGWITVAAVLALYVGIVWPVEYEVGDGELLIRYGFVRNRIPLEQISHIRPSRNPLASPALSLDRIRLDRRGGGFALVSPADRGGFVRAIVESRRGIEIDPKLGGWSALSPGGAQPVRTTERPPVDALEKDGRSWRIGGANEVSWIAKGVTSSPPGYAMTVAIPPIFEAYATFYPPGDRRRYPPGTALRHEQAVVKHLVAHTPAQSWWLGFLETGAHDVVFDDAPRVSLYFQWDYVIVEAGPEQALTWRTSNNQLGNHGALPDLFFPADRSWLVSGLWDDGWTCIGGPKALIESLHRDPEVAARIIGPDDDRKPPELPRW